MLICIALRRRADDRQPKKGLIVFKAIKPLFNHTDRGAAEQLAKGHLLRAMQLLFTPTRDPLWTDPALDGRRVNFKTRQLSQIHPESPLFVSL